MTGIVRIASDLVSSAVQEAQSATHHSPPPQTNSPPPTESSPTNLPQWLRPIATPLIRTAARFGSAAEWTSSILRDSAANREEQAVHQARENLNNVGREFQRVAQEGGDLIPYWERMLSSGAQVETLAGLQESVNEGQVLLNSLDIMSTWGGGNAQGRREIEDYRSRLAQCTSQELEDEVLRWFPSYLQGLTPYVDPVAHLPPYYENHINAASRFLATQNPEEISTRDVAGLAMLVALEPHAWADPAVGPPRRNLLERIMGDGNPDLQTGAQAYRDAMRNYLSNFVETNYGEEDLAKGLPPQNLEGGLSGMALPNYRSSPATESFRRFEESHPESLSDLLGDFAHLEATLSTIQGINSIWNAQDSVGQYDHNRIGFFDDWFLGDDAIARLQAFSAEAQSRAGYMDEGLGILANASNPEERREALAEFEEHQAWWQGQLGTDEAFFNHLPHQLSGIEEMNQGRDSMAALIESGVLTLATLGTSTLFSLGSRLSRAGRGLRTVSNSTLREAAFFEASSLAWDGRIDPGRRVSIETTTGEDMARNGLRIFQTLGLFGTMNAIHQPFQRALRGIDILVGANSASRRSLALRTREGLLRAGESAAEVVGNAAYQSVFDSTVGQLRDLWGDPTFSMEENLAQYFHPRSLGLTLPLSGINNFLGWAVGRINRRSNTPESSRTSRVTALRRRALEDAGLNPRQLSEDQLGDVYHWLELNGLIQNRLLTGDERHWLGSELPASWDGESLRSLFRPEQ